MEKKHHMIAQFNTLQQEIDQIENQNLETTLSNSKFQSQEIESLFQDIVQNMEEKYLIEKSIHQINSTNNINCLSSSNLQKQNQKENFTILKQLQKALNVNMSQFFSLKNMLIKNSDVSYILQQKELQNKKLMMKNIKLKQKISKYKEQKLITKQLIEEMREKDNLISSLNQQIFAEQQTNLRSDDKIINLQELLDQTKALLQLKQTLVQKPQINNEKNQNSNQFNKNFIDSFNSNQILNINSLTPNKITNPTIMLPQNKNLKQSFKSPISISKNNFDSTQKSGKQLKILESNTFQNQIKQSLTPCVDYEDNKENNELKNSSSQRRYSQITKSEFSQYNTQNFENKMNFINFQNHIKLSKSDFKKKSQENALLLQSNQKKQDESGLMESMQLTIMNPNKLFESIVMCKNDDDFGNTGSPQIDRTSKNLYKQHMVK